MSENNSSARVLQLTIGSSVFTASLLDNPTVSAFRSLLPLTLRMADLNGNEKHADLSSALPTAATNPGSISTGDLMLYGSRTLVLWYEDYSTTYSYTRIGAIEDAERLAAVVGGGQIEVELAMEGDNATGLPPSNNRASGVGVSRYGWSLVWLMCLANVLKY